jgi:hypothetical protein
MKYFQLNHSLDEGVIGKDYPQVQDVVVPTTVDDPKYLSQYTGTWAPKNTLVPKPLLGEKAKPTDLISASAAGLSNNLLVSDELKFLIEVSNYKGVDFLETSLVLPKAQSELKYWIIHPYENVIAALNLEETTFFWTDYTFRFNTAKQVQFSTFDKLLEAYEEVNKKSQLPFMECEFLFIENVSIKQTCLLDFFTLKGVLNKGIGYFVSEKLRDRIDQQNCTGIHFTELNQPYP